MRRQRGASGLTLIEVLVGAAILAFIAMGAATLLTNTSEHSSHQRRMSTAIVIGRSTMDELLSLYMSDPDLSEGSHSKFFDRFGAGLATAQPGGFEAQWDVIVDQPLANMKTIKLNIRWTEGSKARVANFEVYR